MFFTRCKKSWKSDNAGTLVLQENDIVGVTHIDINEETAVPTGWLGGFLEKKRETLGWFPMKAVTPLCNVENFDVILQGFWQKGDEHIHQGLDLTSALVGYENEELTQKVKSLTEENEVLREESSLLQYDRDMLKWENVDVLKKLAQVKKECERWCDECEHLQKLGGAGRRRLSADGSFLPWSARDRNAAADEISLSCKFSLMEKKNEALSTAGGDTNSSFSSNLTPRKHRRGSTDSVQEFDSTFSEIDKSMDDNLPTHHSNEYLRMKQTAMA